MKVEKLVYVDCERPLIVILTVIHSVIISISKPKISILLCTLLSLAKGAFTIYVDQFSEFSDPSLPIGRPFIY